MKYIIMADGKELRWHSFTGIHKWEIRVHGERLLDRTVRLVKALDPESEVIITSHCETLQVEGARRYEPLDNKLEIDRFTWELIDRDVVFLYGDCFYTEEAIGKIVRSRTDRILFFGNTRRIFAVRVGDEELFRKHMMNVKQKFLAGEIRECIGWQLYQSFQGLPFGERVVADDYELISDETRDFNEPMDFILFNRRH